MKGFNKVGEYNALESNHYSRVIIFIILLCTIVLYLPGINGGYFGDDFQFVFDPIPDSPFYYFSHANPINPLAYRPIQATIMIEVQRHLGMSTVPIHAINIGIHCLLIVLVYIFMRRFSFSRVTASIAATVMAISQVNVHSVMSCDTLSQSMATLFCTISLLSFATFSFSHNQKRKRIIWFSAIVSFGTFLLALFSKETSVSVIPGVFIIGAYTSYRLYNRKDFIRIAGLLFLFLIGFTAFYLLRSIITNVNPSQSSGRYGFEIGFNIVRNFGQYIIAAVVPFSTVDLFVAAKSRNILLLGIAGIFMIIYGAMLCYGLYRYLQENRKHLGLVFIFFLLGITSSVPVIFLNHISELYSYNMMPFLSVLIGISMGWLIKSINSQTMRIGIISMFVFVLFFNVTALINKTSMMKQNGELAEKYIENISSHVGKIPANGSLGICLPQNNNDYSVFRFSGFKLLVGGLHRIQQVTGRYDIKLQTIRYNDNAFEQLDVCLALENGAVVSVYP